MSRIARLLAIEPLGRDREQAIKARVFAQLDQGAQFDRQRAVAVSWLGRRRWPLALGLAALAVAVLLLVLLPGDESESPGRTKQVAGHGAMQVVTDDEPLLFNTDGARLMAQPHSAMVVNGDDRQGPRVTLERGAVTCEVAPRAGHAPFRVRAGEVEVAVVGTVFSVWRQGEAARVAVTRGVVELHYRGATRRLGAGESWAPPGVEGADAGQGADAGVHAGVHGNDAEDQSPPKPRQPPELAEHTREPKRRDSPDKPRTEPAGKTRAPVSRPPAKERYETAARLERSNPERSIELYAELVAEGGAWAATALFAQGRLEYERGRTDEARKLLERYLRRHRTGANAQVARKLLEELEP